MFCHMHLTMGKTPAYTQRFHTTWSVVNSYIMAMAMTMNYNFCRPPAGRWVVDGNYLSSGACGHQAGALLDCSNCSPFKKLALVDETTQELGNATNAPGPLQVVKLVGRAT